MSLLRMSLAGGVLVAFTAILRGLLQKRLPRWAFLALWSVALVRFLIPFSIPSPVSAYTAVSSASVLNETVRRLAAPAAVQTLAVKTLNAAPTGTDAPVTAAAPFPWLTAVWIIGMVLCAGFFIYNHLKTRSVCAQSLPCGDMSLLIDANRDGAWRKVSVRVSDQIVTPLTYGLIHPVILLPRHMDEEGRGFVMAHELCHIRRLDVLWKSLFAICACLHWFNPLAWVMLSLVGRDLELSCDGKVIRSGDGETRKAYALTLIRMEEKKTLINPAASAFSHSALEQRIKEVLSMKRRSLWAVIISIILVASCAVVFATSAPRAAQSEQTPAVKSEPTAEETYDIARMLLDQDERLNELSFSLEYMLSAVFQDAFASGEYSYARSAPDTSADSAFSPQKAVERAAAVAGEMRNIPDEVSDNVNWPAAIRDMLIAQGLSYDYISEHFLVNWCYLDIVEYAARHGHFKDSAQAYTQADETQSAATWDLFEVLQKDEPIPETAKAAETSVNLSKAVGGATVTADKYLYDGDTLYVRWEAEAERPALIAMAKPEGFDMISTEDLVYLDNSAYSGVCCLSGVVEQTDLTLTFYALTPKARVLSDADDPLPFADTPTIIVDGDAHAYLASYRTVETGTDADGRWRHSEFDAPEVAGFGYDDWTEQMLNAYMSAGYIADWETVSFTISPLKPEGVVCRVADAPRRMEGGVYDVEMLACEFSPIASRLKLRVEPRDIAQILDTGATYAYPIVRLRTRDGEVDFGFDMTLENGRTSFLCEMNGAPLAGAPESLTVIVTDAATCKSDEFELPLKTK